MSLLSRPWFRLAAVGVLTLVGIVGFGVIAASRESLIPLPYRDDLQSEPHTLRTWDNDVTRARYRDGGYEILIKASGRKASVEPNTWSEWDLRVEVSIDFSQMRKEWREDEVAPTAGVICVDSPPGTRGSASSYEFRVGPDGSFAIYRVTPSGLREDYHLLASNVTTGAPRAQLNTPARLTVECQRRTPTTLRLSVDGRPLLSVQDEDARFWGRAGLVVGAGNEQGVSAIFRDLVISGR
jgi:hypothetical protein